MKNVLAKFILILCVLFFSIYICLPKTFNLKFDFLGFKLDKQITKTFLDRGFLLGLDLVGGSRLVFEADTSGLDAERKQKALLALSDTMQRRVNLFGVSEANILLSNFEGRDRIIIELPGVTDTKEATSLVGKTAQLNFAKVKSEAELENTDLTGADLESAKVTYESIEGKPVVQINFNSSGAQKFAKLTEENVGKVLPILLDDSIVSAPVVSEKINGGVAQISGNFTPEQAKQIAVQLNAGALPLKVSLIEEKSIGASLGDSAIEKSIRAGIIGIILVGVFMVVIYGRLGLVADIALIIFALISLALYKLVPIVLTLPGITGFLLTVGMAVDANILIFERFKEEKKRGLPIPQALELSFGRAWNSIRDANIATLATAFVLANPLDWSFLNTSGSVRGFAYTLALGVLVGMFTGIFVSRNLLRIFYRK